RQVADVLAVAEDLADRAGVPPALRLVAAVAVADGGLDSAGLQLPADPAQGPASVGHGVEDEPDGEHLLVGAEDTRPGQDLARGPRGAPPPNHSPSLALWAMPPRMRRDRSRASSSLLCAWTVIMMSPASDS